MKVTAYLNLTEDFNEEVVDGTVLGVGDDECESDGGIEYRRFNEHGGYGRVWRLVLAAHCVMHATSHEHELHNDTQREEYGERNGRAPEHEREIGACVLPKRVSGLGDEY